MARQFTEITKEWQRTAQANATASPGPPMCSIPTSSTWARPHRQLASPGPSTPTPTAMWSHEAIKRPEGPLPVQGTEQGGSQLAATSRASRRLRPPPPRSRLILSTQQKAHDSEAYLQDCHDPPADFGSPNPPPSPAGTRTAERPA